MVPIDSASPRGAGDARSLHHHPDANAGIVDVPGHGSIVDAFAGEGGHGGIKTRPELVRKWCYWLGAE
jgi:hypothetical protein